MTLFLRGWMWRQALRVYLLVILLNTHPVQSRCSFASDDPRSGQLLRMITNQSNDRVYVGVVNRPYQLSAEFHPNDDVSSVIMFIGPETPEPPQPSSSEILYVAATQGRSTRGLPAYKDIVPVYVCMRSLMDLDLLTDDILTPSHHVNRTAPSFSSIDILINVLSVNFCLFLSSFVVALYCLLLSSPLLTSINRLLTDYSVYLTTRRHCHARSSLFYSFHPFCPPCFLFSLLHCVQIVFFFFLTLYLLLLCYLRLLPYMSSLSSGVLNFYSIMILTFVLMLIVVSRYIYVYFHCIRMRSLQIPSSLSSLLNLFHYLLVPLLFFLLLNLFLVTLSIVFVTTFFYPCFSKISTPYYPQSSSDSCCVTTPLITYNPIPCPSICPSLNHVPYSFLSISKISLSFSNLSCSRHHRFLFSLLLLLSGDISLNPGPSANNSFLGSHLNVRSVSSITENLNKPAVLQEFITDNNIQLLSLCETWLKPDSPPPILNGFTPPNYTLIHSARSSGGGGGLAFLFSSLLKVTKVPIPTFPSFESLCVRVSLPSSTYTLLTIYRPPDLSKTVFCEQFSALLEELFSTSSDLIITGDFNFHVDDPTSPSVIPFLTLLTDFNLTQHVTFPTHLATHTLDLLISSSSSNSISSVASLDPAISDHCAILFSLSAPVQTRPSRITKQIRLFRSINLPAFTSDILSSALHTSTPSSLDSYVSLFDSTLTKLLDIHAPLKTITCPTRPSKPFITSEIRAEKSKRSKLESIFRKNRSPLNKDNFSAQAHKVAKMITVARRTYYRSLVLACSHQPKKLWAALNSLLSR